MPVRRSLAPRALPCLAALAIACAAAGCTEPPAGVHVIVTMKDGDFDAGHAFDHLTVTARVAGRRADACLFPDPVDRAVPLDAPSPNGCADLRTWAWTGPPTAASWAFSSAPRTLNVDAIDGEEVEITVTGGLGGRLGTVRGEGKLAASPSWPELTIALAPGDPLFPGGCDARLDPSFPAEFDMKYGLCEAPLDDCPATGAKALRSPAVACLDNGTTRIRNGPSFTCGVQAGEPVVWRSGAVPPVTPCVRVFVRGQLVRCKDGNPLDPKGCVETTACAPKPLTLWSRAAGADAFTSAVRMDCLPPTTVPITWSVFLALPEEVSFVGISQSTETADEDACFLDVEAIATTSNECAP